eukprot:12553772-Ditylum_brightwellii.AAC.1
MESQHTNETGEGQELLSVNDDEQLLTQESEKDNGKEQDDENKTAKDIKAVAEEPAQQETGKNVMTMVMLTQKQYLL